MHMYRLVVSLCILYFYINESAYSYDIFLALNCLPGEVFLGSENSLLQVQKLTVATSCQFDLEKFPFDTQRCSMVSYCVD